jgi:hypothetical protein
LLHHLHGHTEADATQIARGFPAATEAVEPGGSHILDFIAVVRNKLGKLIFYVLRANRLTTKDAKSVSSFV